MRERAEGGRESGGTERERSEGERVVEGGGESGVREREWWREGERVE